MKTKLLLQAGALALALAATSLPGAVIYSTSLNTTFESGSAATSWAQGFTVGSSSATLSSVVLSLGSSDNSTGNFHVALWNATFTTKLEDLTGEVHPAADGNYSYTGSYSLAASTTYNVVASLSGGTYIFPDPPYFVWKTGNRQSGTSAGTWQNDGSGWTEERFIAIETGGNSLAMQVNTADLSPVPEPSEWAAVSVAMLGLVYVAKRRLAPVRQ